ncbi:Hpt domain-containing protein [bacterium]|nr:Hpt domain-containing protein [bacterium]MBU1065385.1 Hpt domain-containing protein [bacterium]MBU1635541.1 Hpt domain-containing protein [bacterium]MBU1874131.1 Hpt domain-containing protein [bacterium]
MDVDNEYLDDPEFQLLIRKYLKYLLESLREVKSNLDNRDFEKLRLFGHGLKGAAGGYGFDDFSKMGSKIETASLSENIDYLKNLISDFEAALKKEYQRSEKKL